MKTNFSATLELLTQNIQSSPNNHFFNNGALAKNIVNLEYDLGIQLPYSFKIFLNSFNGGFICGEYESKMIHDEGNISGAAWNSNYIFGLEEIREAYTEKSIMRWKFSNENYDVYPFIPFCRTSVGEILIFINPLQINNESPVFDACHEELPSSWGTLYKDFTDLLECYVKNNGDIETTSYKKPTVENYL